MGWGKMNSLFNCVKYIKIKGDIQVFIILLLTIPFQVHHL